MLKYVTWYYSFLRRKIPGYPEYEPSLSDSRFLPSALHQCSHKDSLWIWCGNRHKTVSLKRKHPSILSLGLSGRYIVKFLLNYCSLKNYIHT